MVTWFFLFFIFSLILGLVYGTDFTLNPGCGGRVCLSFVPVDLIVVGTRARIGGPVLCVFVSQFRPMLGVECDLLPGTVVLRESMFYLNFYVVLQI